MNNIKLAERYAKSLLDVATTRNIVDVIYKDVQYLKLLHSKSTDFRLLMSSPIVKPIKKNKIIEAIVQKEVNSLTSDFLKLLVAKTREMYWYDICLSFDKLYNKVKGINAVHITSAVDLSDDSKRYIEKKLNEAGIKNIAMVHTVNKDLIGGLVIEYNDRLLNLSVQRELFELKRTMSQC
ncbi:MAG: ATP synthase F1 subunit delta [Phycisphaerales bacterium]|nr:ATP synthase F1 subunit delta [Phycisphaerales bacterium]